MTEAELWELRALCDAAPGGPWTTTSDYHEEAEMIDGAGETLLFNTECYPFITCDDAFWKFVAAARTAVPRLLDAYAILSRHNELLEVSESVTSKLYIERNAEVEALRAEVERLRVDRTSMLDAQEAVGRGYGNAERERDELKAEVAKLKSELWTAKEEYRVHGWRTWRGKKEAAELQGEVESLRRQCEALVHDTAIESDYICPSAYGLLPLINQLQACQPVVDAAREARDASKALDAATHSPDQECRVDHYDLWVKATDRVDAAVDAYERERSEPSEGGVGRMSVYRFSCTMLLDSRLNSPEVIASYACLQLGRNLAVAAALTRAFELGELNGWARDDWEPGCGRAAP